MIAVLISISDARLGHVRVADSCLLIKHRGNYFVKTADSEVLPEGGTGAVFVGAELNVYDMLDLHEVTPNFSKRPVQR